MASRLIDMKEAAHMLGVSADELNEMRSKGEIYGYRDGASWKFKMEELERTAQSRGVSLNLDPIPSQGSGIDDDLDQLVDVDDDNDMVLVSEQELGRSGESASSTIIGKGDTGSDLKLAEETGSDVSLAPGDGGSDVRLVAGQSDVLRGAGASDVLSSNEPRGKGPGSTADLIRGDTSEHDRDAYRELDANELALSDEDLSLGEDDLDLGDEPMGPSGASSLDLDDDDLVLDSGVGSDVTKNPGGSGIGLATPTDVGLDLGEDVGGLSGVSGVDSLELGEADDEIDLEMEAADPTAATQLKADDDFLLTPVEDLSGDESDSGSQVIALDTEEFDESADTLLGAGMVADPLLEAEADLMGPGGEPLGAEPQLAGGAFMQYQVVEAPYSVWNVLSLLALVLLLGFTGMIMFDLIRSVWSWNGVDPINSEIMDGIIALFDKNA